VSGPLPSIRGRLGAALLLWSLLGSAAIAVAVTLAARHEVDELLDETLESAAAVLSLLLPPVQDGPPRVLPAARQAPGAREFAWQVVSADGRLLLRSDAAPAASWHATPQVGLGDVPGWRLLGVALASPGHTLYVGHTHAERREARAEVTLAALLGTFGVALLGLLALRAAVRSELEPLARWSQRLAGSEPEQAALLAAPTRAELVPMHAALQRLTQRLEERIARERAWSAHAAHALRTPLAGIDAQLAVAWQEAPPALQLRLARARTAAARLQRVVDALIGLFRSEGELRRTPVEPAALLQRLPVAGLTVQLDAVAAPIEADADLLSAALANLLDNAARHGAHRVSVGVPRAQVLRVADDGPGVDDARRAALRQSLESERYDGATGLGLMLADRVARAHGGRVVLPPADAGFVVELRLGPDAR
jgi:signal transduction histidine kinase